ncbi:hypothetical protein SUDANB95_03774 [Actinosynnema sp. ALI-1.44]
MSPVHTPFEELDAVLAELTSTVRDILGDTYVGTYVQGSFALKAGDMDSDCDFIVAVTEPPSGKAEADLRALHDEIPTRPGFWTGHLEGSYADTTSLRGVEGLGVPWLFCDHGHRELIWDTHCNSLHTRWILRNHGITLDGPPIADLVDEVPPDAMREAAREALPDVLDGIRTWASLDWAWTQRYIVATHCRVLYTLHTAKVASKRGAMEWAYDTLDPRWRPLLAQVIEDRSRGADPDDPPRPGSLAAAREFARYVVTLGARRGSSPAGS